MSLRSALSGGSESGTVSSGRPIRKCAGVSVEKSFVSLDGEVVLLEVELSCLWFSESVV